MIYKYTKMILIPKVGYKPTRDPPAVLLSQFKTPEESENSRYPDKYAREQNIIMNGTSHL